MPTRSSQSRAQEIEDYLRAQEQIQAEREYKTNRPWERGGNIMVGDMFGSLQDDPLLRAAREANYDATQADAQYSARTAPGQYWENPATPGRMVETSAPGLRAWETNQSVSRDIFGGQPAAAPVPKSYKSGSTLLERDPITGQMVEVYSPPSKLDEQFDLVKLKAVESRRNKLTGMSRIDRLMMKPGEYEAQMAALDDEENKIIGKRTAAAAQGVTAPGKASLGRGFIGIPGASESWMDFPTPATGTENAFGLRKSPFDLGVEAITGGEASAPRASSRRPAATKASLANQLSAAHPDWSREKIISEVNRQFR